MVENLSADSTSGATCVHNNQHHTSLSTSNRSSHVLYKPLDFIDFNKDNLSESNPILIILWDVINPEWHPIPLHHGTDDRRIFAARQPATTLPPQRRPAAIKTSSPKRQRETSIPAEAQGQATLPGTPENVAAIARRLTSHPQQPLQPEPPPPPPPILDTFVTWQNNLVVCTCSPVSEECMYGSKMYRVSHIEMSVFKWF